MTTDTAADPAEPRIQSVARAARILEVVAASPDGMTPKEIGAAVGLRLPTTYHLLQTLEAVRLLRREGASGGRYLLGFGVGRLASAFDRQVSVPEQLAGLVKELGDRTGEAVYGSGWAGEDIVILTRQVATRPVGVAALPIGLAGNASARASGKMLLALLDDEARERYLDRHEHDTVTASAKSAPEVRAQFAALRDQGYAVDEEEHTEGVCCVAAPVRIGGEQFCVALSVPADRFRAHRDELVQAVVQVATQT